MSVYFLLMMIRERRFAERFRGMLHADTLDDDAATPPPTLFQPLELVRAAHEVSAEQALHRARAFQHLLFQQLAEAEADLLIEAQASSMEQGDLGEAMRGPIDTLETAFRVSIERHRLHEAEAARESLHGLSSQLTARHEEQMRTQAAAHAHKEQRADARLKAARRAAQMRLVEARATLEPQAVNSRARLRPCVRGCSHVPPRALGVRLARAQVRGEAGGGGAAGSH